LFEDVGKEEEVDGDEARLKKKVLKTAKLKMIRRFR
jgi:hypothetical protein